MALNSLESMGFIALDSTFGGICESLVQESSLEELGFTGEELLLQLGICSLDDLCIAPEPLSQYVEDPQPSSHVERDP